MRNDFETGYLEHSAKGTTWTKKGHKWIARKWLNGKWIYTYKISGKGYLDAARNTRSMANVRRDLWRSYTRKGDPVPQKYSNQVWAEKRQYEAATRKNMNDYYTKSLAGITEATINKGRNTISKLLRSLKPQTTVRITSNLMPANTEKVYKKKK